MSEPERVVIAYEPVWDDRQRRKRGPMPGPEVHAYLVSFWAICGTATSQTASESPYGGSLKPEHAKACLLKPTSMGGLIGARTLSRKLPGDGECGRKIGMRLRTED